MTIAIIGAGALGSLFGGLLAKSGERVWLFDPLAREHIAAIQREGLVIERSGSEETIELEATTRIDVVGKAELVALFVKAPHTDNALTQALPAIGPTTQVLSLQNGLGVEEVMAQHVDVQQVLRGVTSQGATFLTPGRVRHAGQGATYIGRLGGAADSEGLERVVSVFNRAGIETHVEPDVDMLVWKKLLINAGINALTAVFDVNNGTLVTDDDLKAIMRGAVREALDIARQRGREFSTTDVLDEVERVCENTADNISSMLQDVRRGAATEVRYINGAVVREGERLGMEAPLNRLLARLVEELPRMNRRHK